MNVKHFSVSFSHVLYSCLEGGSGTVGLVDKAKKTGTDYEDAIEDAIIACNEPKDASVAALKHYLAEYHTEFNVAARPKVLQNCLER